MRQSIRPIREFKDFAVRKVQAFAEQEDAADLTTDHLAALTDVLRNTELMSEESPDGQVLNAAGTLARLAQQRSGSPTLSLGELHQLASVMQTLDWIIKQNSPRAGASWSITTTT